MFIYIHNLYSNVFSRENIINLLVIYIYYRPTTKLWCTYKLVLVEQDLLTIPEHLSSPPVFSEVRIARSLVLCVVFCRLLYVPFLWLCCLSFDLRILVTPLVSSNSSCAERHQQLNVLQYRSTENGIII